MAHRDAVYPGGVHLIIPDRIVARERSRIVAIVKACETMSQPQLLEKLIISGMAEEAAIEYVTDVAAAYSDATAIHTTHSPEGGQRAQIDYAEIYARQNRTKASA